MSDDKVSVKEALDKLYDLSWMIGSTAMEYLTDKDGEKIRDYIGVIEDRINDLEGELSEFKKYFEPYDIDEENAEAIIRSKCPNIDSAKDYSQSTGKLSDNTYVAGIVNKYKNYFGKSRVVVIKSQLGQPIVAYSGDEVYWKIPKDLPKMTKLMIDGKALYIHRANFQIIDTALLD